MFQKLFFNMGQLEITYRAVVEGRNFRQSEAGPTSRKHMKKKNIKKKNSEEKEEEEAAK